MSKYTRGFGGEEENKPPCMHDGNGKGSGTHNTQDIVCMVFDFYERFEYSFLDPSAV